jgi:hypothetical protein
MTMISFQKRMIHLYRLDISYSAKINIPAFDSWQSASRNNASTNNLNRDYQARDRGNMRTNNYSQQRSSGGGRSMGGGGRRR